MWKQQSVKGKSEGTRQTDMHLSINKTLLSWPPYKTILPSVVSHSKHRRLPASVTSLSFPGSQGLFLNEIQKDVLNIMTVGKPSFSTGGMQQYNWSCQMLTCLSVWGEGCPAAVKPRSLRFSQDVNTSGRFQTIWNKKETTDLGN